MKMRHSDQATLRKIIKKNQYHKLSQRLKSFLNVNFTQKIAKLTSSGYRYSSGSNFVICHQCYQRDYNFLSNRDPDLHHGKLSPNCPVLLKKTM